MIRMSWSRWGSKVAASAAVLAVVSISAASSVSAQPSRNTSPRPTVVLVHGAWADSTSWSAVAPRLEREGYTVVTPDLGLMTMADDVATVRSALDSIPGKKLLVAHSYGGMVISNAAYGRTDIVGLVFAAAFVPDEGDSIASLGTGFTPSAAFGHLAFVGAPFASPAYIAPNYFRQFFAQDLSLRKAALLNAAQRPLNFPIVFTPSGPVAWKTLPSWYAVSGDDQMIDPAQERWMATRIGATVVEFPTASHVGGITRYAAALTELIEHAART
jgi:pimeloyl-ACP methyl ester carboxylesterase